MSRLTRFTTTRLRNRLRRPWAIRPSILRGGLEMAPALPPRRATIEAATHALGPLTDLAPALPPRRATIETATHALGPLTDLAPALPRGGRPSKQALMRRALTSIAPEWAWG